MPPTIPNEPFADRLRWLKQELELALKWNRPSILLVIYSSTFVQEEAADELIKWLGEQGQNVVRVYVTAPDSPVADLPRLLYRWPDRESKVFFVSGLKQGAPTTWNSLNNRRELLVRGRIRVIFWLTEGEAAQLPQRAPDFWAFRHRTVEFLELPMPTAFMKAERWAWKGLTDRLSSEELQTRITLRERLLRELPDDDETILARAQLHYTLGVLYHRNERPEQSFASFSHALSLANKAGDEKLQSLITRGLGDLYAFRGQYQEAEREYQKAIELNPQDAVPHSGLGHVYAAQGRYEEAEGEYQRAIELSPQDAVPHGGLGYLYAAQGRYEEAEGEYQKAIELEPGNAIPYSGLGDVYAALGRYEKAEIEYQKAIGLDPRNASLHGGLGGVYAELGRYEEAEREYQKAIELDPQSAALHGGLGDVYAALGRYEEAEREYQKAIELDPQDVAPHNGLGSVYTFLGQYKKAEEEFRQAIGLNPQDPISHNGLGNVYTYLGRFPEAEEHYKRAIELDPLCVYPVMGLAMIYHRPNNMPRSNPYLDSVRVLLSPNDFYGRACLEALSGDDEAALEHLSLALKRAPGLRERAVRDPKLESIRKHPRFWELYNGR